MCGMDETRAQSQLGALLTAARARLDGMSMAKAARRAEMSESRWRQIEAGYQNHGHGVVLPTQTSADTILAMARAVKMTIPETREALRAGGFREFANSWRPSELASEQMLADLQEAITKKHLWASDVQALLDQVRQAEDAATVDEQEGAPTEEPEEPPPGPMRRTRRGRREAS